MNLKTEIGHATKFIFDIPLLFFLFICFFCVKDLFAYKSNNHDKWIVNLTIWT